MSNKEEQKLALRFVKHIIVQIVCLYLFSIALKFIIILTMLGNYINNLAKADGVTSYILLQCIGVDILVGFGIVFLVYKSIKANLQGSDDLEEILKIIKRKNFEKTHKGYEDTDNKDNKVE